MNRNFRTPYKIAIGFILLALLAVYGYRWANDYMLGEKLPPIPPGKVNIIGVDTSAGYGILVENRLAKLVQANKDQFRAGEMSEQSLGESTGTKRFIPIKDMLKGLNGDGEALGNFVMKLNDIKDPELSNPAIWKSEDIEKAIGGDKPLRDKLERDTNVRLDGTPLPQVSKNAIYNGILVDFPVPIKINVAGPSRTIVARVKLPYRPRLVVDVVEQRLKNRNYNEQTIAIEYAAAARDVLKDPSKKEDVASSLRKMYAPSEAATYAQSPTRTINSIAPIINENQITGARYTTQDTDKGKRFVLYINLNGEGRKRLWQFTRDRVGSQLLLVIDGVAIAAPFVQHGISDAEVQISGLEDESIVADAVDTIKELRGAK